MPPLRPVPRSKGCITCTMRKTRCDGRRPACQACERRKQTCRGYRRGDFVFMNEGWMPPGVASSTDSPASIHKQSSSTTETPALSLQQPLAPDPRLIYASFFLSQFDRSKQPPQTLVMINTCQRYFGLLLDPSPFGDGSNPLPYAAEALVMNHFGKLNASPRLVQESISPYIKALRSMSSRLAQIQRVGIDSIEEEEIMQLVFACLYLAFWELATNPQGTVWQKHVRGLANILQWRGPQGFQLPRSLQVITLVRLFILLESVSSKHPTFLSGQQWQRFRNLDPSLIPWNNGSEPGVAVGPIHYLDFILDHLITISNLAAQFSDRLTKAPSMFLLQQMEEEGKAVLERLEPVLNSMMNKIGGNVAKAHEDPETAAKGPFWGRPLEYNLTSLCRTAAITLRLLLFDIIREQQQLINPPGMLLIKPRCQGESDSNHSTKLREHRTALTSHVEAIVNMIPYSSDGNIFGVAPLCFVPAFRIAKAVLSRERTALGAEGRVDEVERCLLTEAAIQRHLDFVASKKIPIKVDI
ncbi:hypothetical protein QBC34DRAFT_450696 [Podospora aff. communis PSN243]|uniref:Zn(2)-C6 fungal-type domain-containing protein n=1 Tax=Podospora aff. communis PSN243 TaxID=3040156 RepID=A0AAV9GHD2_9PEZI|nr:hypothetical protein QBC34DRAFT_450696 [Podospora aff. communis PSN243]